MKMMRKNWKDRKGVSPVIATILMVAITVVLAAVLYVMVMGFGGDGATQAPTLKLTADGPRYTVSIDKALAVDKDIPLKVKIGTAAPIPLIIGEMGEGEVVVTFVDAGDDGKINTGDYFTYEATDAETGEAADGVPATEVVILWTNGDTNQILASFNVPAVAA